jgi:hypothetical protein
LPCYGKVSTLLCTKNLRLKNQISLMVGYITTGQKAKKRRWVEFVGGTENLILGAYALLA